MKLPFVSRTKYEELWDEKVARDITIDELKTELNDMEQTLQVALKSAEKSGLELQTHRKMSEQAQKREKNKRAKHINELKTEIEVLKKSETEHLETIKNLKKQLEQSEETCSELTAALENEKRKPTVEDAKFERIRHENKLVGSKKGKK